MIYNQKLIEFFERHNLYDKDMFDYFMKNTIMIDYNIEEDRTFIGCYWLCEKNALKKITLIIPYISNEETMLISIHEIVHAIIVYKYLNKKITSKGKDYINDESLPLLYEKIFVEENKTPTIIDYANALDKRITNSDSKKYKEALKNREELYKNYNYDIDSMLKLSKKLSLRHKRN